jgi:hypothetical protein
LTDGERTSAAELLAEAMLIDIRSEVQRERDAWRDAGLDVIRNPDR